MTFKNSHTRTQIDFFLKRVNNRTVCNNCKAIPTKCLMMQHMLLVMDVKIKSLKRKNKIMGECKVKWWRLTGKDATKLSENIKTKGSWNAAGDADKMWGGMVECIRMSAKEILGVSRWGSGRLKRA